MAYHESDSSSGTDDDLPPPHPYPYPYPRTPIIDLQTEIHNIEQLAYYHLLRALNAQSDAITWDTQGFISKLRQELRVSDGDHLLLLSRVNADETIRTLREWRKSNGPQSHPIHESITTPTVSASRKKHKTGQSAVHPIMQPPSSAFKRGRGKKTKGLPYPSAAHSGRPLATNRGTSFGANEPVEAANFNPLIGRKVSTRWPEDKNFYVAVITDFKEGQHALVYDINTPTETWEWVDLNDIPPQDIRWEGEDGAVSQGSSRTGQGRGMKNPSVRAGAVSGTGRGRGALKGAPKKDILLPQNGIGRKGSADIELLHTDTLIKDVEKVFSGNRTDLMEVEKAEKVLKEHEQALIEAIARLADASDGESDEGDRLLAQEHLVDQKLGWRKRQYQKMHGDDRGGEGPNDDEGMLQ